MEESQIVLNWDSDSDDEIDWKDAGTSEVVESSRESENVTSATDVGEQLTGSKAEENGHTGPQSVKLDTDGCRNSDSSEEVSHKPPISAAAAERQVPLVLTIVGDELVEADEEEQRKEYLARNSDKAREGSKAADVPCKDAVSTPATVNPPVSNGAVDTNIPPGPEVANSSCPTGETASVPTRQDAKPHRAIMEMLAVFLHYLAYVVVNRAPQKAFDVKLDLLAMQNKLKNGEIETQAFIRACRDSLEKHVGSPNYLILYNEAKAHTQQYMHRHDAKRKYEKQRMETTSIILSAVRDIAPHAEQVVKRDLDALETRNFHEHTTILAEHLNKKELSAVSERMIDAAGLVEILPPTCTLSEISRKRSSHNELVSGPPQKKQLRPIAPRPRADGTVPVMSSAQHPFRQQQARFAQAEALIPPVSALKPVGLHIDKPQHQHPSPAGLQADKPQHQHGNGGPVYSTAVYSAHQLFQQQQKNFSQAVPSIPPVQPVATLPQHQHPSSVNLPQPQHPAPASVNIPISSSVGNTMPVVSRANSDTTLSSSIFGASAYPVTPNNGYTHTQASTHTQPSIHTLPPHIHQPQQQSTHTHVQVPAQHSSVLGLGLMGTYLKFVLNCAIPRVQVKDRDAFSKSYSELWIKFYKDGIKANTFFIDLTNVLRRYMTEAHVKFLIEEGVRTYPQIITECLWPVSRPIQAQGVPTAQQFEFEST